MGKGGPLVKEVENLDQFALNIVEKTRLQDKSQTRKDVNYKDVMTLFSVIFKGLNQKIINGTFKRDDIDNELFASCIKIISHRSLPSKEYFIIRTYQKWIRKMRDSLDFRPKIIQKLLDLFNEQWIHCYHFREISGSYNEDYLILEGMITETKAISEVNQRLDTYLYKVSDSDKQKEEKEKEVKQNVSI